LSGEAPAGSHAENLESVRAELRDLTERRRRGDLTDKRFHRKLLDLSVELARAEARVALPDDEPILAEHHIVHSHFKLTESLLKEPVQATVSMFATARRLLRVRGSLAPEAGMLSHTPGNTVVDQLDYGRVRDIDGKVEWRWGEVGTGLVIVLSALLLRGLLAVTGPVLMLLGIAGVLHGLLLPTRWIEVVSTEDVEPRFAIHGAWRKSARQLLAVLRHGVRKAG